MIFHIKMLKIFFCVGWLKTTTEKNIHTFGGQAYDNSQNIRTDALLSSHTDTEEVLIVFFIKNAFITKLPLFVEKEEGSVTHIQLHLTLL